MKIKALQIVLVFCCSSFAVAYEVWLWVPKGAEPKIDSIESEQYWDSQGYFDGPCGWIFMQDLDSLARVGSDDFVDGVERVFEFNVSGEVVKRWAMPVSSIVYGIAGDSIFVSWGSSVLKISSTGKLEESAQVYVKSEVMDCPNRVEGVFTNSAYARCFKHIDLSNNKPRLLTYEGVCT